jgi:DNA polymerase-3 subunit epsilon
MTMANTLLIIDTETTGLDPRADRIIEVAAALYDIPHRMVLWSMASLVPGPGGNPAAHVNGIPETALQALDSWLHPDPFTEVARLVPACAAIVAHNADFGRRMVEASGRGARWLEKPWICSMCQLAFPRAGSSKKLTHLAADHGISTIGAHRAMADVLLLVALFQQTPDLDAQVARALKPHALYCALAPFERKEDAKTRGFSWNGGKKRWEKWLPVDEADHNMLPFAIRRVLA